MSNEEIVKQIQQGINTGDNIDKLYRQNHGMICKIARRYTFMDDMDDLLQEAYFGLYEAVQRYEDIAGVLFMTYALFWIRQSIVRCIENNVRGIKISSGMQSKVIRYKRAISAYELQLGRKPTDYELCRYLGVNDNTLKAIKKAYLNDNIQSMDEVIPGLDDMLVGDSIPDQRVDIENDVVNGLIEKSLHKELWQIVKENVSQEENRVIECRYKDNLSLEMTGKMIGQNRDRVRTIEAKAIRKLRYPRIRRLLEEKYEVNYSRGYCGSLTNFKYTGTSIVEDIAIRNLELSEDSYICTRTCITKI